MPGCDRGPGDEDRGFLAAFAAVARDRPDRVFARFDGHPLTFGELDRRSAALAASLLDEGLATGSRVAVMLRNSLDALAVILGLARARLIWVPLNVQQRGAGLAYLLDHCSPALIIAERDLTPALDACGVDLSRIRIVARDPGEPACALRARLSAGSRHDLPTPDAGLVSAIMYTSGTTGPPKGVLVTHRMMRRAADGVAGVSDATPGDVFFVWEPLFHIGGAQLLPLPALAGIELAMTGAFSASRFWAQVARSGATHIHYLGGILQILLKLPPSPEEAASRVRVAWGGGCPAEVFAALRARFGFSIRECYGMTEMSSITTCADGSLGGVVGRALPWFTVTVRDRNGAPVATGLRGEIVVETDDPGAFFPGYYRAPEASAEALRNGRLHTGDMGSMDPHGILSFHGRQTDSFRVRGENVSAWEVERVVNTHPGIEDCAAVGVAAAIGEADILLHVQLRPGSAISAADLSDWLASRLAPYQQPRFIAFVPAFDRTPSLRIMKHRLSRGPEGAWDRDAAPA